MTDQPSKNVFYEELNAPIGTTNAPAGTWDTESPAPDVDGGVPVAEGNKQSVPHYYPAGVEAESEGGTPRDTHLEFHTRDGTYEAATEGGNMPYADPETNAFQLKHYQRLFDVDTMDVLDRILGAIIFRKEMFAKIEPKPDLYGPFWICTTCIFLMAMISNALDYFAHLKAHDKNPGEEAWEGDLRKIAKGASVLYGYVFGFGFILWTWLKIGNNARISLSAIWCMYGYSMAIWLPVTLVAIFPSPLWLWVVCLGASLYGGVFLIYNTQQAVRECLVETRQYPTLLTMFIAHQIVAVMLRLYVFTYNHSSDGKPKWLVNL